MAESYLLPTRVECYAGSRADEEPRAIWVEGARRLVTEVVDRWYQGAVDRSVPTAEYFRVRTEDGELRLIRHEVEARSWYLVERLQ